MVVSLNWRWWCKAVAVNWHSGIMWQSIAEGLFKAPWTDKCFILTLTRQIPLPPFLCGNTDPKWSMWVTATNGTILPMLMYQCYYVVGKIKQQLWVSYSETLKRANWLLASWVSALLIVFLIAIAWPPLRCGCLGAMFALSHLWGSNKERPPSDQKQQFWPGLLGLSL